MSQGMGNLRSDIKRSESVLNRLEGKSGLTEAGKQWLISAFDPFHDTELNVTGYPDSNNRASVVQEVNLTFTVSAPSASTSGNVPWDCHIVDFPFLGNLSGKTQLQYWQAESPIGNAIPSLFVSPNNTNNEVFGGLGAYTFLTSAGTSDIFSSNVQSSIGTTVPLNYLNSPFRVISKGFEVYNTTADLYKSGSVVIYKQPTPDLDSATSFAYVNSGAVQAAYCSTLIMEAPPSTVSEAMLLTQARQWDAREGCYVIPSMHKSVPAATGMTPIVPMYYENSQKDTYWYGPNTQTGYGNWNCAINQNWTNFDQTGAIFSGLHPSSVLTVNYKLFIETFPTSGDLLQTVAKPSPMCDPIALDLYSSIVHMAPIGVMVKYNGLGDWFIDGINAVKDMVAPVASKFLTGMKHPVAQAIGKMIKPAKKKGVTGKGAPKAPKINAKMKANQKLKTSKASDIYG